ncbi:MAG: peptidoglycan bridge formation glycyltransferase FemA/FemB family protein [Candidatus Omnitrophica bacterium]|nr:peptidoglycan bridge formation glycyltransferase FemA/FemB family protein [Candidatus Omnitrophota bacterium]
MQIIFVKENQKKQWDEFIASNPDGSFLQSWAWGDFQKSFGRKIWRLAVMENNEIMSAALIIKHSLPFGWNYFYCPRPINLELETWNLELIELFFEEVKKMAEKEKTVFLKVDPVGSRCLRTWRHREPTAKPTQPQHTLILNISKSEKEILARMKQKTRYNIRLAERKGVKIKKISQPNDQEIQTFLNLSARTSKRDQFQIHPEKYYQKMLKILCQNSMAKLFFAEYQNEIIAANIVIFFSGKAVYLHGASSNNYREAMAPHLLHWEQIKEAKKLGCQSYDFWGIEKTPPTADPLKTEKNNEQKTMHRDWAGITRFKKGFGGEEISYPESWDFIFDLVKYWVYRVGKKIKNKFLVS